MPTSKLKRRRAGAPAPKWAPFSLPKRPRRSRRRRPLRDLCALALAAQALLLVRLLLCNAGAVDHCYSDLGCFPLSAEFYHPQHRPFNVRPWRRDLIKTQFELFNRHHPQGFLLVPWNAHNLKQARFDARLETKIIIPGWLDNIDRALWVRKLKDALLWLWAPVNIVVVRWRNFTPYTLATANTRVVGAELANLLKFIEARANYDRAYYHIIGHSLGAHIAGYCGDRVHGLGRITALDPARPFFQGMPKSVRLDRGDAKFVDAIHSDFTPENAILLLMSYGMTTPVGHLDFYPNGPPLFQPGCLRDTLTSVQDGIARGLQHNSLSIAFLESVRYLTACDHQRSHEWFIESITNRECAFVGVRCNEYEGMINGRCTCDDSPSACAIMGIHADQMYLNNVHEELWPVRAGSIDYKYRSARPPPPIVVPPPPPPPLMSHASSAHYSPFFNVPASGHEHPHHNQQQQQQLEALGLLVGSVSAPSAHPADLLQLPVAELAPADNSLALTYQQLQTQATKEAIYAELKHQADRLRKPREPTILEHPDELDEGSQSGASVSYRDEAPAGVGAEDLDVQASEQQAELELERRQPSAFQDAAFVQYLKMSLLASDQDEALEQERAASGGRAARRRQDAAAGEDKRNKSDSGNSEHSRLQQAEAAEAGRAERPARDNAGRLERSSHGEAGQFDGHPLLLSNLNRDIESWYEDNSKWFLKTNNRPKYCSNQYQLMVFLGPLQTRNGRDSLRANLLVSIIGSRGQLLNQRFVPRGATLNSFTMQPFFILLEGSYSLGQIKSVAVAWEARKDPAPVQATVTFQSGLLETLGARVPAYQAKNHPWLPETMKLDLLAAPAPGLGRRSDAPAECRLVSGSRGQPALMGQCGQNGAAPSSAGVANQAASASGRLRRTGLEYDASDADLEQPEVGTLRRLEAADDYEEPAEEELADQADESEAEGQAASEVAAQRLAASDALMAQAVAVQQQLDMLTQQQRQLEQHSLAPEASSDGALFVPLVDLPHPAARVRPANAPFGDIEGPSEGELSVDLHNIELHHGAHISEDSIVINQVIVSPLQAYYGHHGRTAKAFCPPRAKRKLRQDKTVRLTPALMGRCH